MKVLKAALRCTTLLKPSLSYNKIKYSPLALTTAGLTTGYAFWYSSNKILT